MITYERQKDGTLKQVDSPPKRAELMFCGGSEQRIMWTASGRHALLGSDQMTDTEREVLCARIDELCAENERLRQENQSIGTEAYEVGYKSGSVHYELEHCPACKNVADLQEALDENDRLRSLCAEVAGILFNLECDYCGLCDRDDINHPCPVHTIKGGECLIESELRELGV